MRIKTLFVLAFILILCIGILFVITFNLNKMSFFGLQPVAFYNGYRIYDLVKQKKLPCAEMVEYYPSEMIDGYQYYFPCLKSNQIIMVKKNQVIKIKDAYQQGLISIEKMYEFGLIERTEIKKSILEEINDLTPLYQWNGYSIYDLVIQKGLVCATSLEVIGNDGIYQYYLNCIKSGQIYFIKDDIAMDLNEAYINKVITLEQLYTLGILGRLKLNE